MPRKRSNNPFDYLSVPRLNLDPEIKRGIIGVLLLVLAVVSILSLFQAAGLVGQYLNKAVVLAFGWGKWLFPLFLLLWVWFLFFKERYATQISNYIGLVLLVVALQGLLHVFINPERWQEALSLGAGGGYSGWLVVLGLDKLLGFWASLIILLAMTLIGLMLAFNKTLAALWKRGGGPARFILNPWKFFSSQDENVETTEDTETTTEEDSSAEVLAEEEEDEEEEMEPQPIFGPEIVASAIDKPETAHWEPTGVDISLPLNLLDGHSGKPQSGDIKKSSAIIQKTLEEFGIAVEMGEVSVGPTVTQYTLKPADGVKLSRITALNNDLAMALAAHPVRIEAPIPGKSLVGIEVPNKIVALVNLKSILASPVFTERKTNTMVSLGKDVAGRVWLADLHKMPHLLVAGATGSGKSVMLNSLIISLLYENNPDDLRFIMVDPKRVELTMYNDIPHLLTPVITEVSKTINALKWCMNEMDRRFQTLAQSKKRDIDSYNQTAKQKMPYIIFVIDELADLMVVAARDVEPGIIRLAQMARAVGIHLVLATQRPSVNVITGTIKANMPARIAFAVASSIDSRTILDGMGAEKLLGKGDMLFIDPAMPKPKRLQGAYVSDLEIKRVVRYLKKRTKRVFYLDHVTERQKVHGMAGVGIDASSNDDDELTEEAKQVILTAGKASATLLQRRLSIGYARAAKILDILEERGVVGPAQGAKPREVLLSKGQYELMQEAVVSNTPLHKMAEIKAPDEYLPDFDEAVTVETVEETAEEINEPEAEEVIADNETTEDKDEFSKYFSR